MKQAAIAFLIIPVVGLITAFYLLGSIQNNLVDLTPAQLCAMSSFELSREFGSSNSIEDICNEYINPLLLLKKASLVSMIVAVAILILFNFLSNFCGTNRDRNALIFPKLIPVTILIIAAQVLVQGIILAYLSFIIPGEVMGIYLPVVTFLIGGGAAIGCFQIIASLTAFFKKPKQVEKAVLANKEDYPKLWEHIESISEKIHATKPDNIILGLEPTFYATSASVELVGDSKTFEGETLYLSLPLMKLFNMEELSAVVGHELGHFKAKDTNYSTKFAPVYSNLGKSINNLANTSSSATALAKLPAIYLLSAMYDSFSKNIASISREREFEADKVGCEASSKEGLVYSLAKVVTFSKLWTETLLDNIKRLNNGRVTTNLSEVFRESSLYNIGQKDIDEIIRDVLPSIVQHPTDSHPPLAERYANIEFDVEQITRERIISQGNSIAELIDDVSKLEEELTTLEHRYQVALGLVNIPEEVKQDNLADMIYLLAAGMIGADGKLELDEVRIAEEMGVKILEDFDRVEFRAFIDNLENIPVFQEVVEACKDLSPENKKVIYNYLEAIANADDELAEDEEKMLNSIKETWNI